MSKEIIEQGIQEAYDILSERVVRDLSEDLNVAYDHYEYLDFSDNVFEFLKENDISEILEPAILTILERVREALQE